MTQTIEQVLPVKVGATIVHKRWQVDVAAAARSAGIPVERMARDAAEMAEHFPRWVLALVREGQPLSCSACDGLYLFDGGIQCAGCAKQPRDGAVKGARAGWFGVLPPIGIDGLQRVRDGLRAKPPKRHVVGTREPIGTYVLVPLVVAYPPDYPRIALDVHYLPEFRDIPGMPKEEYSHKFHMIGAGRMCLFAGGEWRAELTPRHVLQQRAYPHAIKFLNYANGKTDAFAIVTR